MSQESKTIRTPTRLWTPEKYNLLLRVALLIVIGSAASVLGFAFFGKEDAEIRERGLEGRYIYNVVQSDDRSKMVAVGVLSGDPELNRTDKLADTAFVAYSIDTGATWTESSLGSDYGVLYSLDIDWNSGKGICAGRDGVVLYTSDNGINWSASSINGNQDSLRISSEWNLVSIDWQTGKGFWCAGDKPEVFRTNDYGHTWTSYLTAAPGEVFNPDDYVLGMSFDWSSDYGVMSIESTSVGGELVQGKPDTLYGQYLVQTFNGGDTWERVMTNAGTQLWLRAAFFEFEGVDIAGVNRNGQVCVSYSGPVYTSDITSRYIHYTNIVQPDSQILYHELRADFSKKRGVAIAYDSTSPSRAILAEFSWDYTGGTYNKIVLDTVARLTGVSMNSKTGAFVVGGAKGKIWVSNEPGEWTLVQSPVRPSTSTSEFMLIFLCLALAGFGGMLGILIYRKRASHEISEPGNIVESVLGVNPDNPTDQDKLGFTSTTKALVDLMRNPDLRPPLSVVVNGDWGSGKTSLMLQVKKQLEEPMGEKRFITTWFNIWHFENEEQMFHAFITSLSNGLEKAARFRFRMRVFYSKLMKLSALERFTFGFSMGFILVLVGLLCWMLVAVMWNWVETRLGKESTPLPTIDYSWLFDKKDWVPKVLFGGGTLGAVVLALLNLGGKITKSGLSAIVELIPLEKLRMKMDKGVSGVREQFRKEFREIMKAAKKENASLVVFIDDLDRANGEQIRDILATMNFISDVAANAGNTDEDKFRADIFFVMGMASDIVVNNMNRSMFGDDPSKIVQGQSAENYLEKMVDIVIRVPQPQPDLLTKLTTERSSNDEE